jgi:sugar/nucleoside kinase (ribokinase family)
MNLWITTEKQELLKLLKQIDGLVLNDGEARLLTEEKNLIKAAKTGAELRPEVRRHQKGRARQPARHARR